MADAKLKAIERAIGDETEDQTELPNVPSAQPQELVQQWIHKTTAPETAPITKPPFQFPEARATKTTATSNLVPGNDDTTQRVACQHPFFASTPLEDETGSYVIEALTSTNKQIVAGLARQSLPKCHPDTFSGDAETLFHPWKKSFKAMITDAEVSAEQEVNYLRSFTSGEVQRVVDNFRRRQLDDPVALLRDLWKELERRFGSTAVITNTLLERLREASSFGNHDNAKLLCADVDSQLSCLPGLACLNFPNAIRPITEKLPSPIRAKWEKEIATYADKNDDAYPGFSAFARLIVKQARTKNHPKITAGSPQPSAAAPRRKEKPLNSRVLLTRSGAAGPKRELQSDRRPWCHFHEKDTHALTSCKAFAGKPLMCFLCLTTGHRAKDCQAKPTCDKCVDNRHNTLLHKDKEGSEREGRNETSNDVIGDKCTAVCQESGGGISCSKVILVDIAYKETPQNVHRMYAIIDDQSNTSLISSELADMLEADGPEEKYFLTTCSSSKETKFGRRVTGLLAKSVVSHRQADLPVLVECDRIPEDRSEIPTPEMAKRFLHLEAIADEIPPLDRNAAIHILLGRDAPELLKVRAFKNGPRGAPWAQKLLLGWTLTGQVCLHRLDGRIHIQAHRTTVKVGGLFGDERQKAATRIDGEENNVIPCPNQLKITDSLDVRDVFHTTPRDNEPSLSCDDRKFLKIMENGIHKNASGNWEMPLPFRHENTTMPNNRNQTVNRLNGLLRTLRRKPQMQEDYLAFMAKVFDKGHTSPVPPEESKAEPGRVWYLPHFGVYHPKKPTQIRVVFDSSAEFDGVSLNKELLAGPDLMNSLLGVLIRFRKETVATMCDIEQMFHSFHVDPADRNFLRFLWYKEKTILTSQWSNTGWMCIYLATDPVQPLLYIRAQSNRGAGRGGIRRGGEELRLPQISTLTMASPRYLQPKKPSS